jgi:hypothetical protein
MSVDPILLADNTPMLISPFESFVFCLENVQFSVSSGMGYPGQGGVYHGKRGRLFLSSYRVVYVEMDPAVMRHFRSFSLPLYALFTTRFEARSTFFGRPPRWTGVVAPIPGRHSP